jgi:drug/metabolite transporter (DMT)-like permease
MADAFRPTPPMAANRPVAGVLWMLLTGALFVAVTAVVKHLGDGIPAAQAAFLRYSMGLVFLIPLIPALMRVRLSGRAWGLFGLRGAAHTVGVMLWFYAMTRIPIAEVTAINYMSPIYVAIGAALFLGERMAARRILAIVVALVGGLLILRPGFREVSPGHLAMLATALLFAISYLIAKRMSGEVNAAIVVALLSIGVTIGLAPFAWAVWVTPTLEQLSWLFLVALLATAGHYTMTLAFAAAPMTVTQPVTYLQLVWAVVLGMALFDEPADVWVVLGGTVIMASVSFITWREAVLRRQVVTPPAEATKV